LALSNFAPGRKKKRQAGRRREGERAKIQRKEAEKLQLPFIRMYMMRA